MISEIEWDNLLAGDDLRYMHDPTGEVYVVVGFRTSAGNRRLLMVEGAGRKFAISASDRTDFRVFHMKAALPDGPMVSLHRITCDCERCKPA